MTGFAARLLWMWLLWLPVALLAAPQHAPAAAAPERPALRLLLLSSFHASLPAQRQFEEGLQQALSAGDAGHQVFAEYLDSARLVAPGPAASAAADAMAAHLQVRYGAAGVGAIVALQPAASDFLQARPELLPQARRIHVEIADAAAERIRRADPRAAVISAHLDYGPSIDAALRLMPVRRLVVVGQTQDGAASMRLAMFRSAAARLGPDVLVDYLLDWPLAEVQKQVAALPRDSVVYYLLTFNDGAGRALAPYEAARRIAEASAVPVVSQWESLLGSGIVGGYSLSHDLMGREAARLALAGPGGGAPPARAQASAPPLMRHVYDVRQLRRFGIAESGLPEGSVLLFREPTLLQQYRLHVLAAGAVFSGLLLLLLALAASNRGRRRALLALDQQHALLAQRVAERTAELDVRVTELGRRNDELVMMKSQLSALAHTDGLTGLANRRRLDEVLGHELRRLQRQGGQLSLVMLDVDCFKAYNDRYGHVAGDHCLQAIAELLGGCVRRPADLAARYGGEEFVLVLPDTAHAGALLLAQQVLDDVASLALPHAGSSVAPHVTVSAGVVTIGGGVALSPAELLARADVQLYRAKSAGRHCVVGQETAAA